MNHEKLTELLVANGLRPTVASTLACWTDDDYMLTQRDIEQVTGLRQPEISLATQELRRRGWLHVHIMYRESGRGRPAHQYYLARPMAEIVAEIVAERMTEIERAQITADRLLQAVA